jgi:DAHP synthase ferredoxin-like domain
MIVVMADGATESNLDAVVSLVESSGVQAFVSRGAERVIVGLVGDVELCSADSLGRCLVSLGSYEYPYSTSWLVGNTTPGVPSSTSTVSRSAPVG